MLRVTHVVEACAQHQGVQYVFKQSKVFRSLTLTIDKHLGSSKFREDARNRSDIFTDHPARLGRRGDGWITTSVGRLNCLAETNHVRLLLPNTHPDNLQKLSGV